MAVFTEVLPATKSVTHRAMTWNPVRRGVGVLEIADTRTHTRYAVCELAVGAGFSGWAFKLTKTDGEIYCVCVGDRVGEHSCDCKGFVFGRGKACKHIAAVVGMLDNGWAEGE